ncbi:hypothetical protein K491DRAFT_695666 [Lophiostoma macrostomum CBS 122681]|uniref:Uncharacterized protein n=1 Tax=Lophiostoma macrostomum CBS 122681 TaxID=1314788 RepID=A0A6A6SXC6_9PLEO|nr:hypothetical protein K491DRAFT_695666 [Lophiostoma macrostomum CBS 122681]
MPRPPSSPSPPPALIPLVSGSFDYPPASASPPPPTLRNNYESFQQFLAHRDQDRVNTGTESEHGTLPPRRTRLDPSRRRSQRRTLPSEREPLLGRSSSQTTSTANRPRATPSERYLRRSEALRQAQRSTLRETLRDFTNEELNLSDLPVPNASTFASSSSRQRSPANEMDGSRRQTKRRKLEHDVSYPPPYNGFKYGYKGQVVPGRLKMEIVSCDGGEYDKRNEYGLYPIQNVLRNDKSVYCSEKSRCNLLLKHIGEMPFTLEKVVIKAPDRGFTAPVQEGLIFVAMSSDDLISGTSGYKIEYESPSPRHSPPRMSPAPSSLGDQQISLREAVDDPYIWENSRQGQQEAMEERIERMRLRSRRQRDLMRRSNELLERSRRQLAEDWAMDSLDDAPGEHCEDPADENYTPAAAVSAPTPPPFTITTESEEDSDANEDMPSAAIMADRMRRESRWRTDSDEDEEDEISNRFTLRRSHALDALESYGEFRRWRNERHLDPIRATRRQTPSRIVEPKEMQGDGLIAPHANFFIAKHKNKITIKFHPAVSGKFVLLKLWSPTHDGNIDIESVQFHGYSGPRYFPAVQPA